MILIFNHNIIKLTNYFDTKEINKIIDTSLRYNKILYEATDDKKIYETEYKMIAQYKKNITLFSFFETRIRNNILVSILLISLIAFAFFIIIFYFILKNITRPYQQILKQFNNYLKHQEIEPIKISGDKKIKNLITLFNENFINLKNDRANSKIRSFYEARSSIGKMIVHEIKNQMTPINLKIESLLYYNSQIKNSVELNNEFVSIQNDIKKIEEIIKIFRDSINIPEPICINFDIIQKIGEIVKSIKKEKSIFIETNKKESIFYGDTLYFELIITNIIKNSYESDVNPIVRVVIDDNCIKIIDNGCGIPDTMINKIFYPGFTSKEKGDGIGLFVVKELCTCLNIDIKVNSKVGCGTEFILLLN